MNARSRAVHLANNIRTPHWTEQATCATLPPHEADRLFFTDHGGQTPTEATEMCGRCPVAGLCADAGATERYGVWGGLNVRAVRGAA